MVNVVELENIVLVYNTAEKFERIKDHMESCRKEEMTNEDVARVLLCIAVDTYRFD